GVVRDQPHHGAAQHRLAGPGLAHQAEGRPRSQVERDAVDGTYVAAGGVEDRAEVLHHQQRRLGRCGLGERFSRHSLALLGSQRFWTFSPNRLNEKTVRNRQTPGTITMKGCSSMMPLSPSAIMLPHVGLGAWMPRPRYDSDASATISDDT